MKTNEMKDLHNKTEADLQKLLNDNRKELTNTKLEHTRGKLKNVKTLSKLRKNIAQIATILRGKELTHGKNA